MMKMLYRHIAFISLMILVFESISSCKKYLDAKSDQALSIPQTLDDLQALLKNPGLNLGINQINGASDEYYLKYNDWLARPLIQKQVYVWDPLIDDPDDWNKQYNTVFYANTVLFNLDNIPSKGQERKSNSIKGSALFFRANAFYQLAQLFAQTFDSSTAAKDLGIPLRLTADFSLPSTRATIQETYDRVIRDFTEALALLPPDLPINKVNKSQPNRAAAFALLARTYLQVGNYQKAKESSDSCLLLYNILLDFNSTDVDSTSAVPISPFNSEMLFYATNNASVNSTALARVDSNLYNSFNASDLRKSAYFVKNSDKVSYRFKGSYNGGSVNLFDGTATDEVYLIRAECYARIGNIAGAMQDLNTLLSKRWKTGAFQNLIATSSDQALALILQERKKELIYRGIRWSDLKRLNKDTKFSATISRSLNGSIYNLTPADLRYAFLLPQQVVSITTLQQNKR